MYANGFTLVGEREKILAMWVFLNFIYPSISIGISLMGGGAKYYFQVSCYMNTWLYLQAQF